MFDHILTLLHEGNVTFAERLKFAEALLSQKAFLLTLLKLPPLKNDNL